MTVTKPKIPPKVKRRKQEKTKRPDDQNDYENSWYKKPKQEENEGEDGSDSPDSDEIDYELDGPEQAANDNWLVFGLSKGSVVFIRMDNLEFIYARFQVHR